MVTRIMKTCCPFCGALHDRASNFAPGQVRAPTDGDLTLCIDCGEWCEFEGEHLVIPSDDAYQFIGRSIDCTAARMAWLKVKERSRQ